ncbi:hypothetical protein V6N11_064756 [Hibiscus sabdariffa]|uniref:Transposase MuDR plant domain-containing protein n=2 Tax=Hibiscus sabdariffa TaxID=183260 RepID=A0ABR2SI03_9ROSI
MRDDDYLIKNSSVSDEEFASVVLDNLTVAFKSSSSFLFYSTSTAGEDLKAVIEELHADFEGSSFLAYKEILPGDVDDVCEDLGTEIDADSNSELKEDDGQYYFMYDVELLSDVDEELVSIGRKLTGKSSISEKVGLDVSDNSNDKECVRDIELSGDALEEYPIKERDGKLEGHESEYLDSSDSGYYGDGDESDEKICGTYYGQKTLGPKYDPKCAIPTWEVGMRFEDNIQFKEAVKKYSVAKGLKLKFVKNEPKRTRVHCRETCPWKLYASYDRRYDCYVVKTYNSKHVF